MEPGEFRGTSRFQIKRRIGAGGMGVVYEAYDRERCTHVAVKTLRNHSADAVLRLKREFRALQDIQHPNLVSLGELIQEAGVWFFTMELLRGVDFLRYVTTSSGQEENDPSPSADTLRATAGRLLEARAVQHEFDETRLRRGLSQLACGLQALHDADKLHRDVKPSNIIVTEEGRVVLLDFGLVLDSVQRSHSDTNVVGTALYMAPEQSLGERLGPPTDWYSVGVVLYESLVGVPPFVGPQLKVMMDKQRLEPPAPTLRAPRVPEDLNELCVELLRFEPKQRPSAERIRRVLGVPDDDASSTSSVHTLQTSFLGRQNELEFLAAAFADACAGRQVGVLIQGESGIGKSALMRQFCDRAVEQDARTVILAGRCFEREAVPYNAIDSIVDELASLLRRTPKVEAAALTPRWASLLLQSFPVLARVDVFASAPHRDVNDPAERRTRLFAALRDLFSKLAERQPLIITIDDLQWADADSLALLTELLRPPDAPPILLLATWREQLNGSAVVKQRLAKLPGDIRHLTLEKLPVSTTTELASILLARNGLGHLRARQIAEESDGHPLFVDELVRFMALRGVEHTAHRAEGLRLEEALRSRLATLDPRSMRVLEFVAIAGAPLEQDICANVAEIDPSDYSRLIAALRVANLARSGGARKTDRIEPYHDRVRAAVIDQIEEDRLPALHEALARALEASGRADSEALALHYSLGGDHAKAAAFAVEAAQQAERVLAFDQSARLYQLALDSTPAGPDARALQVSLGSALAKAGRGPEAAEAFLTSARNANVAAALDLRARAIQALLNAGRFDRGVAELRQVLLEHGIRYPKTAKRALLSVVRHRLALSIRGLRFSERDESQVAPDQLALVDLHYYAGTTLGQIDNIRGNAFQVRGVRLALKTGEPYRVARALTFEAGYRALAGSATADVVSKLLERAERLGERVDSAHLPSLLLAVRGSAAFFQGRFDDSLDLCRRAQDVARERGVTDFAEYNIMFAWISRALHYTGRMKELARFLDRSVRDAEERGNLYVSTTLRTSTLPFLRLAADDVTGAQHEVADALARWSPARFHVQHYYALYALASAELYAGEARAAYDRLAREWDELKGALLLRPQIIRLLMWDLRARAALSAAASAEAGERRRLLAAAARDARRIKGEGAAWAQPLATCLSAGASQIAGDTEVAAALYERASHAFDEGGMRFHAVVARRRRGALLGGDEGAQLIRSADAWMQAENVKSPGRTVEMMAPCRSEPSS